MLISKVERIGSIGDTSTFSGLGPFSDLFNISNPVIVGNKIAGMMSIIVGFLTVVGGLWFIIQLVVGAFKWMTSGGDKNNVEQAKEHFTHAIISLGILVAAYMIAALVGVVFGLDILNPQNIIPKLGP